MSFRLKIALVFAAIGSLVLATLLLASLSYTAKIARDQLVAQAGISAGLLAGSITDALLVYDFGTVSTVSKQMAGTPSVRSVTVLTAAGEKIVTAGEAGRAQPIGWVFTPGVGDGLDNVRMDPLGGPTVVRRIDVAGHHVGTIELVPELAALQANLDEVLRFQLRLGLVGLLAIAAGGWLAAGALVRRLGALERGAARIADGEFQHRVHVAGSDEIQRTARTVNRMADAILADKTTLERLALTDPLTGLLNRTGLATRFIGSFAAGRSVSVLHIDLDRFKLINDTRGHKAGDAVLAEIARRLRAVAPEGALVARIGGDEFAMVVREVALGAVSVPVAEACIAMACAPVDYRGMALGVGASVGIAHRPAALSSVSAERLLEDADIALYEAKVAGRGQVKVYDAKTRAAREAEADLEAEVVAGLRAGEFVPFLQPQVDAVDGTVVGAEILARWNHPRRGLQTPGQFLLRLRNPDLAERVNDAVRLQALTWFGASSEGRPPTISVNLTATDLARADCAEVLAWQLAERRIDPRKVIVEVLEDVVISDGDTEIERTLAALQAAGHPVEFDDFGTGNSGLVNLVRLSVEQIKMDRSFVSGLDADPSRQAIVAAMIGIGRGLGVRVLAEGVETVGERDVLLGMGCRRMQGFLFARPMSLGDFETWQVPRSFAA